MAPDSSFAFAPAGIEDFDALAELRIEAMRKSLERIGRFDPVRARERLRSSFSPPHTRHIMLQGERIGYVVVRPEGAGLLLDHLYIRPAFQRRGIGAALLAQVFAEADAVGLALRVGALRGSEANRFYQRHGFRLVDKGEWDIYYLRPATL